MVIYFETGTGKIIGGCAADSPDVVITSVPSGCTAVYVDDNAFPNLQDNMGDFQIDLNTLSPVARVFTAQDLADAKVARIQYINDQATAALQTFQSSALGSPHTYLSGLADMILLVAEYAYVKGSDYLGESITWYTVENGYVAHTGAQFIQVYLNRRSYAETIRIQRITREGQINAAVTVAQVNAIVW